MRKKRKSIAQTYSDSKKDRTYNMETLAFIRQHLPTQWLAGKMNRGRESPEP